MRGRPISRLERLVEDAAAGDSSAQVAREFAAGLIRRFPQLTVDEAAHTMRRALGYLRRADDDMNDIIAGRPKMAHLDPRTRRSIERGNAACIAKNGGRSEHKPSRSARPSRRGQHTRRDPAMLKAIRSYQIRNPTQGNVALAYRSMQPGISEKAFRGYWKAAQEEA